MSENNGCAKNTDKELWRKKPGDYYSPSIHITQNGDIGINVGGYVIVASVEKWHKAQKESHKWEKLKKWIESQDCEEAQLVFTKPYLYALKIIEKMMAELEKECDSKEGGNEQKEKTEDKKQGEGHSL